MRNQFAKAIFLCALFFLVSCGPEMSTVAPAPTSNEGINFEADHLVERLILKETLYNNCSSDTSTDISLSYKDILSESLVKELVLGGKAGASIKIPEAVQASIEIEIKERFSSEKKAVSETSQAASFVLPEKASQKITITLKETLREGSLSYVDGGTEHGIEYSYRINLEFVGLQKEDLICEIGPTPTISPLIIIPLPSPTPDVPATPSAYGPCEYGFDVFTWTPASSQSSIVPECIGTCWDLDDFGMSMSKGAISILENHGDTKAIWYGVTRPIPMDARISLNVHWEKLTGSQIWIGFTDYPDRITDGNFLVIKPADAARTTYFSAFSISQMEGGNHLPMLGNVFIPFDNHTYSIRMHIDSNKLSIWLNNSSAPRFPTIEVKQRYFFIGYLSTTQVDIDALISDIQIQP
jgi:hypothetical protein